MNYSTILIPNKIIIDQLGWLEEDKVGFTIKNGNIIITNITKENKKNKLNKQHECSHCNDSGVVCIYNKNEDVAHIPCPKCSYWTSRP